MIQVITGGPDEFNALVYGHKNPTTVQYLENQMQSLGTQMATYSQYLTDAGRNFYDSAQALFERFNGAEAVRLAHAAVRKVKAIFQPDTIQYLEDIGAIQNAPMSMQRWIMAEPTIRQIYHDQRCDGYSESYVDMQPGVFGRDHYDYRRVMNGVVVDDGDDGWKFTIHLDDLKEGDRELSLDEKQDILSTWDIIRMHLKNGAEDPTSPYGGKL